MADNRETQFQQDIVRELTGAGWLLGSSAQYDRARALYPEDLLAYVQETQPEQWAKFARNYPDDPETALLNATERALKKDGTLKTLRGRIKDRGAKLRVCTFKPDHDKNPDTLKLYAQNRLRVVPELIYSPHGYDGRIDLTLFVNGLPVATLELKSAFKQSLENAKLQYMRDRQPKDPATKQPEPLLAFKRGTLVHFAVSQYEVAMTTRLAGMSTFFLPFNKGTSDGGAGNDQPAEGYATGYLWQEVLQRDSLLNILGRFMHLQEEWKEDWQGKKIKKETMIFPRYHQLDAVRSLLAATSVEGTGHKYLIQHSAGSGKSNSIAWLSHQLASLHDAASNQVFDSVIVITDRTVLDSQLQDTIYQFEHAEGVVARISREDGEGSKSEQLAAALAAGTPIIIVTIQTFPFVLKAIQESTGLKDRRFAVIADEAHSSQTGATARQLREVLMAEQLAEDEEVDGEDVLAATLEARRGSPNISYYAFTATPKAKTLELFGRPDMSRPAADDNTPEPFHIYSMRQAIEEGFILDVLRNYITYNQAYKLAHANPEKDKEVESKRAATQVAKWVRLHPYNIAQKVEVIVEHFYRTVARELNGEAKAMVVTSSRKEAVRYKLAFDKYVREKGYKNVSAMVAFSGEVIDKEHIAEPFTERNMNPGLRGRDMRKAFDTNEYQVMLVANKFQTGFDQPKLVAMYVDKKLTGVDCIQTLSRLNRTYPGKENTYVLDFVNDPEDVLSEFKKYYQTAELESVSDPNLIYEIQTSLMDERLFQWHEVEALANAFFDPRASQDKLTRHCKPAVDRYQHRYNDVMESVRVAQTAVKEAEVRGNEAQQANAVSRLKEAKEMKDVLDTFKRNLQAFVRFYEFCSQIVDFDDEELEQLAVYCKHLYPLLKMEQTEEDIDLSLLQMTHYKLYEARQQRLSLGEKEGEYKLKGITSVGSHTPRDQETELLSQILERLNDLFTGENLTDKDRINWFNAIKDKVEENEKVMDQIRNNTTEQTMLGDYPKAVDDAVIGSMGAHSEQSTGYLSSERLAQEVRALVLAAIKRGL
ncbi:type I restriction endonuclease subunit R [Microbulbifer rhizosphaerae]|uniref:Type I restriction enzyme R subunit n=1 Tax=Microbulbifer rhizosphaerae TaxID=1562603 RepID=A0A7W4W8M1_9GAMM|nr:type I restriction endonuclease [Microbulbifer rhizosphaerae]MBB3059730.1 type I restriction enzyme R subunit [Microbulbifer rhizosphaerae]